MPDARGRELARHAVAFDQPDPIGLGQLYCGRFWRGR
jgi:hypothetical protein